jgi:hypothetical protein
LGVVELCEAWLSDCHDVIARRETAFGAGYHFKLVDEERAEGVAVGVGGFPCRPRRQQQLVVVVQGIQLAGPVIGSVLGFMGALFEVVESLVERLRFGWWLLLVEGAVGGDLVVRSLDSSLSVTLLPTDGKREPGRTAAEHDHTRQCRHRCHTNPMPHRATVGVGGCAAHGPSGSAWQVVACSG